MRTWLAEQCFKLAWFLAVSSPTLEAEGIRWTIQNYFQRWKHRPIPTQVTVTESFGVRPLPPKESAQ